MEPEPHAGASLGAEIRDAADRRRYEITVDGAVVGIAEYRDREDPDGTRERAFTHAEVAARVRGQGYAEALVRFALDDTRARGVTIVPACPYVAEFVDEHPEYADRPAHG